MIKQASSRLSLVLVPVLLAGGLAQGAPRRSRPAAPSLVPDAAAAAPSAPAPDAAAAAPSAPAPDAAAAAPSAPASAAAAAALSAPASAAAPSVPAAAVPAASGGDFSFDLFEEKKKSPEQEAAEARRIAEMDRKVKLRRKLLTTHQAMGFVTLGALAATLVIGQLNYQDRYGGGIDDRKYYNAHLGLGVGTTALFSVTGILALAAPNPYPKKLKLDAALLHKLSMALATAGMVTQMVLGPVTAAREGHLDQRGLAVAHLVTGYATFAFMAVGVFAFVF